MSPNTQKNSENKQKCQYTNETIISQAVYQTEDRPKSSACSLCLKLATVGDKITLSGREFHTLTTRLEKKFSLVVFKRQHYVFHIFSGCPFVRQFLN